MKKVLLLLVCCTMMDVVLAQDVEYAEPYLIHRIFFGGGSYYIDQQQIDELHIFLSQFEELENYEIEVHSHTDNIGSVEFNQRLSIMRSRSVVRHIILKNIPEEIILIEDYGELNPLYDNDTWEGKLSNRRVDVIIKPIVL
ncbi:MAG: OmpA family protein [Bacteroidota bacterium]